MMDDQGAKYPLRDSADLRALSGRRPDDIAADDLSMADLSISAETLRAQARVARAAGYGPLAENLERAAELTAVPNAEVLRMYERLRPGRASYAALIGLAETLETQYQAAACGRLLREAAEAYRERGLLRREMD
jgi:propanediol dehydratase small subunit